MTLQEFNSQGSMKVREDLFRCCGSTAWVNRLMDHFPFSSLEKLKTISDNSWGACTEEDILEAFSHHPKIGERPAEKKLAATKEWAEQEQSGVKNAEEQILAELREANAAYEKKFGYIFIVCATGKSANEMLGLLKERLTNDPSKELQVAAREQHKITNLRIDKLFA